MSDPMQAARRHAADAAAALVMPGMVLGLGTGATAALFIRALAARLRQGLAIAGGIPTSRAAAALAKAEGIPLTDFAAHAAIDLAVDGADEVQRTTLALVKGAGGALLREKVVARASRRFVVVVDGAKLVDRLGTRSRVPVEVVPFAAPLVAAALQRLGATSVGLRHGPDGADFVTDNANAILDAAFPGIDDPAGLEQAIRGIPGVAESGLFPGGVEQVLVGTPDGVEVLRART